MALGEAAENVFGLGPGKAGSGVGHGDHCRGALRGGAGARCHGHGASARGVAAGDIFVAIKGDVHDGHRFVANALQAGAGLAVVSKFDDGMQAAGPLLVVAEDPLRGLENMGRAPEFRMLDFLIAEGRTQKIEVFLDPQNPDSRPSMFRS